MTDFQSFERDLLITRGWGVFTSVRARKKILFHQEDHLQRLINSCKGARIDLTKLPPHDELLRIIWDKLDELYRESVVRIIITAGYSEDGKRPAPEGSPRVIVLVDQYTPLVHQPISLDIREGGPLRPEVKMIGPYANAMVDLCEAHELGFDDVLYTAPTGDFKETSCGNIFFVTDTNELWTPRDHVLHGITRDVVMKIAREKNLFQRVEEVPCIMHKHVGIFGEAFRTASITGIVPVAKLDGKEFRTGEGTQTAVLQKAYDEYVEEYFQTRGAP